MSPFLVHRDNRTLQNHDPSEKLIRAAARRARKHWNTGCYNANALSDVQGIPCRTTCHPRPPTNSVLTVVDIESRQVVAAQMLRPFRARDATLPLMYAVRVEDRVLVVPAQMYFF